MLILSELPLILLALGFIFSKRKWRVHHFRSDPVRSDGRFVRHFCLARQRQSASPTGELALCRNSRTAVRLWCLPTSNCCQDRCQGCRQQSSERNQPRQIRPPGLHRPRKLRLKAHADAVPTGFWNRLTVSGAFIKKSVRLQLIDITSSYGKMRLYEFLPYERSSRGCFKAFLDTSFC